MKPTFQVYRKHRNESEFWLSMFIGGMLLLLGVALFWFSVQRQTWLVSLLGLLFGGVGVLMLIYREGIEVDLVNKRYRNYNLFLCFYTGIWKVLPSVDYVTIFRERRHQQIFVLSMTTDITNDLLKVALVYGQNQQISLGNYVGIEEATQVGIRFAAGLETKLLDYTGDKPYWIIE